MANILQRYILKYDHEIMKHDDNSEHNIRSKIIRCSNPNITLEFMKEHPEFKYLVNEIETNSNITIDELMEYAKINNIDPYTQFQYIATNKSATLEDIKKYPNLRWHTHMFNVLSNSNITFEMICNNLDIPWDFSHIFSCPDLTWDNLVDIIDAN